MRRRFTLRWAVALAACCATQAAAPIRAQAPSLLSRRYHDGDSIQYQMDATNQGRDRLQRYSARADGRVRRDSLGRFVEDFEWSHLVRNDSALVLPAGTAAVRQRLTLSPSFMVLPDVGHTHPALVGPVLDLLTFYVDVWLAAKLPLMRTGDHLRVPGSGANSWADGQYVALGEDAVDFDLTLNGIDSAADVVRLQVRHVVPNDPHVKLPSEWMRAPLFDAPNNWVEVTHAANGAYVGAVGRETFDVDLSVRLSDGHIIKATMDNPVDVMERTCSDAALTNCGESRRYRILRVISLRELTRN